MKLLSILTCLPILLVLAFTGSTGNDCSGDSGFAIEMIRFRKHNNGTECKYFTTLYL